MKLSKPNISIIIPVLNEAKGIAHMLSYLKKNSSKNNILEIIVVDGGSVDLTKKIALACGACVISSPKGRAKQLNRGAQHAQGSILYFLHADTLPPPNFDEIIVDAVIKGNLVGCFQIKFDSDSLFLSFFAWFSRVNHPLCRGGDQSLFITKEFFMQTHGFNEKYTVYEDNEFIGRLYKLAHFKILPLYVKTSARRYEERGKLVLQYHFGVLHLKNYLGAGPEKLYDYYKRKIAI